MAASFYSSVEGLGTENVHVTAIRLLFNSLMQLMLSCMRTEIVINISLFLTS